MELWDGYNADGTLAGIDLIRGERIPAGVYHLVCGVLVRHEDGDYLLTRRDMRKQTHPGRMEASAGGSALKGEDALTCAMRELKEETGIDRGSFRQIGRLVTSDRIYVDFLCETDYPKDRLALQDGETDAAEWLSPAAFAAFAASGQMIPRQRERLGPFLVRQGLLLPETKKETEENGMTPIWLPKEKYPDIQIARFALQEPLDKEKHLYAVAEFTRTYTFDREPDRISLKAGGASQFFMYVNGALKGIGPACSGGDFLTKTPLNWEYCNTYTLTGSGKTLDLRVLVRLQPEVLTEFGQGRGMFFLEGEAQFGAETLSFGTDESWLCRQDSRYLTPRIYDAGCPLSERVPAEKTDYPVLPQPAPIPMPDLDRVLPMQGERFALSPDAELYPEFDRIYAAYACLCADADCELEMRLGEDEHSLCDPFRLTLRAGEPFMTLRMFSAGLMKLRVISCEAGAAVSVSLLASHYPFGKTAVFRTDDEGLERVMAVCRHTLGICRQTMHLDSPTHQELLACTGDYYIEMLMTSFENGDLRLADLDVRRTANWLVQNGGRMFHTTYSLIWVQMIRRLYEFTGSLETVRYCRPAMDRLFGAFSAYMGENGVIENPPDYMFVDWTVLNGYSMHHPPKALGQTVLNAFYHKALTDAAYLYAEMGENADDLLVRAEKLKTAFHKCFWDEEKRMYIDGLDTPEHRPPVTYRPDNPAGLRSFSRYPQTLAALYGLCPEGERARLAALAADEDNGLPLVQPYFMHFVLEAVLETGLADVYAMKLLRKWVPVAENCPKGLQEGWIKPEESYSFDHSHAWGGTPAYHLPRLLTGLRVLKPGFAKIALCPRLYGLKRAEITVPTPYGDIRVLSREGCEPEIRVPNGIEVVRA